MSTWTLLFSALLQTTRLLSLRSFGILHRFVVRTYWYWVWQPVRQPVDLVLITNQTMIYTQEGQLFAFLARNGPKGERGLCRPVIVATTNTTREQNTTGVVRLGVGRVYVGHRGFWKYGINALVAVITPMDTAIAEKYKIRLVWQQEQEPRKPEEQATKKIKATASRPPLRATSGKHINTPLTFPSESVT